MSHHYVSTGPQNGYYTLRVVYDYVMHIDGENITFRGDRYIRNLARDRDVAVSRAKELGYDVESPDFDLREIQRRQHEQILEASRKFRGGKYHGEDAASVFSYDPQYVLWFIRNRAESKRDRYTVEHLLTVDDIREAVEAELAKDLASKNDMANVARRLRPLADALFDGRGGFCDSIASDMAQGKAPRGRAIDIVCDIMAKRCGRANSSKYSAEYDRVLAIIQG